LAKAVVLEWGAEALTKLLTDFWFLAVRYFCNKAGFVVLAVKFLLVAFALSLAAVWFF